MIMYKLLKNPMTNEVNCVFRLSDNTIIPFNESNTDYQAFLLWKSEGNEPLPAENT